MSSTLIVVPISQVRENPVALRHVQRDSEQFLGLVESIREKGFLGVITVRKQVDKESGSDYYEVVDGLQRYSAAKDAGLTEISVDVTSLSDDEVLEAQVMMNIHKIETKPADYSRQLRRILARNPMMTEAELARKLGKSTSWIRDRLSLNKIDNTAINTLINEGQIPLSNAYALAKLPPDEQADWVDAAMTEAPDKFVPRANKRKKDITEAKRRGKDPESAKFEPTPFLQKVSAVKQELADGIISKTLLANSEATTPEQGFAEAVKWCLHLDALSVAEQQSKYDERIQKQKDAAKKRATKRSAAKQKKAETVAADAAILAKEAANAAAELEGRAIPHPEAVGERDQYVASLKEAADARKAAAAEKKKAKEAEKVAASIRASEAVGAGA